LTQTKWKIIFNDCQNLFGFEEIQELLQLGAQDVGAGSKNGEF
jgi:hypothetical protein